MKDKKEGKSLTVKETNVSEHVKKSGTSMYYCMYYFVRDP